MTEADPRIVALLARIASEPERAATFICAVVNVAVAVEREACKTIAFLRMESSDSGSQAAKIYRDIERRGAI